MHDDVAPTLARSVPAASSASVSLARSTSAPKLTHSIALPMRPPMIAPAGPGGPVAQPLWARLEPVAAAASQVPGAVRPFSAAVPPTKPVMQTPVHIPRQASLQHLPLSFASTAAGSTVSSRRPSSSGDRSQVDKETAPPEKDEVLLSLPSSAWPTGPTWKHLADQNT
eukprot:s82_g35.t1